MKLLCLTRYGDLGASSRLRVKQYFPYFAEAGISVTWQALLPNAYVSALYGGKRSVSAAVSGYTARIAFLLKNRHWDVMLIEKEIFPWLPLFAEHVAMPNNTHFVLDFDDAVFHNYEVGRNPLKWMLLRNKIDLLMEQATIVTAGSPYLVDRARRAGCRRVELVPTVVDLGKYHASFETSETQLTIGWIGSPATKDYLALVDAPLRKVCEEFGARVVLVGARDSGIPRPYYEYRPWSESSEVSDIASFDVGIMPLPDLPWERGKCGYKLIQYMACGKPVVASPVGANTGIVDHAVNGFLAASREEWETHLRALLSDRDLRIRLGRSGRNKVEDSYSLHSSSKRMIRLLRDAAASTRIRPGES